MKYMLIMRATPAAVEAYKDIPIDEVITRMGRYNEEMMKAGVLLAGEGLAEDVDTTGFVVDFASEPPAVTDGPYGEIHTVFRTTCDLTPCFSRDCLQKARLCSDGTPPARVAEALAAKIRWSHERRPPPTTVRLDEE